jgi:hypothetical protein
MVTCLYNVEDGLRRLPRQVQWRVATSSKAKRTPHSGGQKAEVARDGRSHECRAPRTFRRLHWTYLAVLLSGFL